MGNLNSGQTLDIKGATHNNLNIEITLDIEGIEKDISINYCDLLGKDIIGYYYARQVILLVDKKNIGNSILIQEAIDKVRRCKNCTIII